jgi:hypothetical protein
MALDAPNDRALFNAIAHYEREIPGRQLTVAQLTRVVETAKRLVIDELHSAKAQR